MTDPINADVDSLAKSQFEIANEIFIAKVIEGADKMIDLSTAIQEDPLLSVIADDYALELYLRALILKEIVAPTGRRGNWERFGTAELSLV